LLPERELLLPAKDLLMNREGEAVTCAAQWLAKHSKVPHDGIPVTNQDGVFVRRFYGYVEAAPLRSLYF
jgi:hypothetical protein